MKKLLLILLLFILPCVNSYSQNHLKFKGIPIDWSVPSFANKLTKTGFFIYRSEKNVKALKGKFINKECVIHVLGSKKTNITWKVSVYFPIESDWNTLKYNYFDIKKQFQQKYGKVNHLNFSQNRVTETVKKCYFYT